MMRGRLHGFVRAFWAGDRTGPGAALLGAGLAPAEAAFRAAVAARNAWYDGGRCSAAAIPAVSVGNLTVGGTGKTPVVRWLGEWFRRRGVAAGVVTRGYGGDEVELHRRWFGPAAVFVGADRRKGIAEAAARGCGVALLDDAFQHRRIRAAVDILLLAAEDPWRIRLLPRGPYREPFGAARRATHVLVTHRTSAEALAAAWRERLAGVHPDACVHSVEMKMGGWRDLAGSPADPPCGDVLAVCAIARPRAFADGLAAILPGARIEPVAFPDHHDYTVRDVAALLARRGRRTIVCTAKDAVKLASHPELAEHCVAVGLRVAGEPRASLLDALERVVEDRCGSR